MDGIALDIDFIRKCGYKKKRFAYRVPIGDYNYLQCGEMCFHLNRYLSEMKSLKLTHYDLHHDSSLKKYLKCISWQYNSKRKLDAVDLVPSPTKYSKASRYAVFGSRKKPCSSKPCFMRFIPMY